MYSKVKKVFIGGAVARTALTGSGIASVASTAQVGGIYILDKNKNIMTAGQTIADTDVIYIAETLATNHSGANQAGTAFTYKNILLSDPIKGSMVTKYSGQTYSAKAEQATTLGYVSQTITVGDEYVMRIVYKDIKEHPGQKTQTFRYIAKASGSDALYTAIAALINTNPNSRITATVNSVGADTDTLTLTGKAIPGGTTSVNDIDEFGMVNFEVFFYYVDQTASTYKGIGPFNLVALNGTVSTTGPTYPKGSWEVVRDIEKSVLGQQFGVTNRIWFPVKQPSFRTSASLSYNSITIEYRETYQSPDTGYMKSTGKSVQIFIPTTTADYQNSVLGVLNTWMASTPGAFENVTL